MPYISTRGDHNAVNAKTAIKRGTAPDGGLYVDPNISQHQLFAPMMAATSYQAMARIVLAARHYLMRLATPPPCRFDVVSVEGDAPGTVHWLQAAFDAA